ncbi:MAG: two-component regulator propeller domain-containing protein [Chitinophagaceae bacterium]
MRNRINILYQTVILQFFIVIIGCLIFSCSQKKSERRHIAEKKDSLKLPVTIPVRNPVIVNLDSRPAPLTITIPDRKKDSFFININGSKTVILPPEIKPADFSVLMQNYTNDQGLPLSAVHSSCMDKNGNLWFGTYGGATRYDGNTFTNFNVTEGLINGGILSIFKDKEGNLWFGTLTGVSRYDGRSFTSFTTAHGLADDRVSCIAADNQGNLWFGTLNGVSKYNGNSFTNFSTRQGLKNNDVNSILLDKSGNLWFGTSGGVSRYDASQPGIAGTDFNDTAGQGTVFKNYSSNDGLINNHITTILEDKNGNIWFGTRGGICRLDPDGSFQSFTPPLELVNKAILSMAEDDKGFIWIGTNEGVFRWKGDGTLTNFNHNRGLVNNRVSSILTDRTGALWFCTEAGISHFDQDGKFFMSYTTTQGLTHNSVTGTCEDKSGNLWFATHGGGVSSLSSDRKEFTNYTTAQGLPGNVLRSIAVDRLDNLWFGTEAGLCQLDPSRKVLKVYTTLQGLPQNSIKCITEDNTGKLWVGTTNSGVFLLDLHQKTIATYTVEQGLSNNSVRSILEDKRGNLWFSTVGGGVSRLDQDRKIFTHYTTAQGLANNNSWVLLEDNNDNLWIGTEIGISRYDGTSFANYSAADGMSKNSVEDMVIDKEGVIWVGTENGLNALTGFVQDTESRNISQRGIRPSNGLSNAELKNGGFKPVFEIYNNKTGYRIKEITVNSMYVTREGMIWAGTGGFVGDYLISFDFRNVQKNSKAPIVSIQSLKINNEFVSWYGLIHSGRPKGNWEDRRGVGTTTDPITTASNITEEGIVLGRILNEEQRKIMREKFRDVKFDSITPFYPLPANLVLPYRLNSLSFDFAAIEPARPGLVNYQYILEGYDKDWSPVTDQTTAVFGNMREGRYTFKLKAQSPDGVWSEPIEYSFKVLPPWRRTWWAYTLYALVFLTALWIFIKWRVRKLKKEKILLEEKVVKRTHELQEEKEKVESTLLELKSTQSQLIQSEKMASLGELTAGIAHEIQNPLNFVNNFSEVSTELVDEMNEEIDKGNTEDAKLIAQDLKQNLEKINHHGKRAGDIVKGMLQHSRSSSGVKEPTNINALADEYLRLAYHGLRGKDKDFNATMKTDFDVTIRDINIIPQDVGRVLLNLYTNAFYAVTEKKKQVGNGYEPIVSLNTRRINGIIEIHVRDNGNGISQKVLDKIFQPFFTTKPTGEGTGLGLSLSYDIIKAHSGEIKVETKEGEGSEFVIILPVV